MSETEVLEPTAVVEETSSPQSVPEAPEVASVAGDEPVVSTDTTAAPRPRDPATGRFLKKDGTPVGQDEQASLEQAAAQPLPTAPPAASTSPKVPAGEPFWFRADKGRIPIEGAVLTPDGSVTIPPSQVPALKQLLAEGMTFRGSWRQKESDYQRQIKESSAVEGARAEKYNAASVLLFDRLMDDDWLVKLAQNPAVEREYLRRELDLALKTADLNAPRPGAVIAPQQQDATDDTQLERAFGGALTEEVDDLLDDPSVKALFTPEDRKDVQAAFALRMPAFAAMVDGELKLDRFKLKQEFSREVAMQKKIKQAALDAQKAKDFNAARNKPTTGVPVVSTKGPEGTGQTGRKFKTREEYNKAMGLS